MSGVSAWRGPAVLAITALAAVGPAIHAASLTVSTPGFVALSQGVAGGCDPNVAVSPQTWLDEGDGQHYTNRVTVSGISQECDGLDVTVAALDAEGNTLETAVSTDLQGTTALLEFVSNGGRGIVAAQLAGWNIQIG